MNVYILYIYAKYKYVYVRAKLWRIGGLVGNIQLVPQAAHSMDPLTLSSSPSSPPSPSSPSSPSKTSPASSPMSSSTERSNLIWIYWSWSLIFCSIGIVFTIVNTHLYSVQNIIFLGEKRRKLRYFPGHKQSGSFQVWKKPSGEIVMTGLHKIYIQSGLPWIHAQYNGSQYRVYIAKNTRAIQRIRAQYREYTRNTGKPRVRAIDGSHGVWPRPPLPNRKIGNYPDYFRFWAERAIIAIISDHCRWTENFFIGQQWVDNKLLTGICGGDWWPVSNCDDWMGEREISEIL